MPAAFSNVNVYGVRATTLGMIRDFSNGVQLAAGAGMFTERVPAITGATAATMSTFFGSSSFTQHVVAEWGAPGDYTLDGTSLFLGDFDGAATLDVPGHAITWAVTGGSVQPDLVHVRTFLNRDGATPLSWSWEIAAPGGTKAVFRRAGLRPPDILPPSAKSILRSLKNRWPSGDSPMSSPIMDRPIATIRLPSCKRPM